MTDCKICGLGGFADLAVAEQAGARWGGFVFYPPSPRHIDIDKMRAIADEAIANKSAISRVALVVDADDATLDAVTDALRPALIQCHGGESPDRISAIKSRYGIAVMKAVRVASLLDIKDALRYDGVADWLLFDSRPPQTAEISAELPAELPGGTGQVFDWALMREFKGETPWMLAGGLNADNIGDAISQSHARYVDVSSGVERQKGVKDHAAIKAFIEAVSGAVRGVNDEPT